MDSIQFYLASSLEKVFLTRRPLKMANGTQLSTWRGAHAAVQLVCEAAPGTNAKRFAIDVQGAPCAVKIYEVEMRCRWLQSRSCARWRVSAARCGCALRRRRTRRPARIRS